MSLRRAGRELVQKYLAGIRIGEAVVDMVSLGEIRKVDEVIAHICASRQFQLQFNKVVAMAQQAHIECLSGRQQTQALQILISSGKFADHGLLEGQVGMDGRQSGYLQAMVAEVGLTQPGEFFPGNQQQVARWMVFDQRCADLRYRINSGERGLLCQHDIQPGLDKRWVGQRRKQHVVVTPPGFLALQQGCLREGGAAIKLFEFALQ
ncbi:MAG: hypothetical protein A2451_12615 [Bdellovibrionales bacterium RIFOXYC2_FULL_39_8]|nr:MAG: hypothetical protein A2451_12615 [Bdellovibrionales bacterium RIFOXYC2_FULL_39_8]